ncbi:MULTISPECIES: hypothetical protein [Vibrio diabolicus subgroup]|uniref:hypothetical protein n=1 Tax=Vibrio diabolicus subgroup TaxID=2315253 RepID=UPI001C1FD2EF|nr:MULTISPECIES: hypothetical protein [Vibrio diabolicus subgroup]UDY81588.1 hypothetical protein LJY22_08500 [Vibrio diabolicus]
MGKKSFAMLLVVSIVIMSLVAYFKAETGFLVGNIVPELIGVCVELLIIIFVFDVWQKNEEKNKKIKVERRLREFLIFFLKHNFKDYPPSCQSGNFYGKDHEQNQECLSNLINEIEQKGLQENVVLQVQSYCESEKEIFNNLIPVAADLTNDHFKSWVRIAFFMNAIASKSETTSHASVKILQNIKRFDKESFTSGLYVGAK